MITDENRPHIIDTGMHFMRAITEAYGPETGMKLWSQIAEVLDPSLKGEIFFAMLTGKHQRTIRISFPNPQIEYRKIDCIKAVRAVDMDLGLKEAKDIIEEMYDHRQSRTLTIKEGTYTQSKQILENVGLIVG